MTVLFSDSLLLTGMMCDSGCAYMLDEFINDYFLACKANKTLPNDARIILGNKVGPLGLHQVVITIKTEDKSFKLIKSRNILYQEFKNYINREAKKAQLKFEVIDQKSNSITNEVDEESNKFNIFINLFTLSLIVILYFLCPPSLILTIGLTSLSLITLTFTARNYLFNFMQNLRRNNLVNMNTTVSFGWLLSIVHTFYHVSSMPLVFEFSMLFMSFMMPILLIVLLNIMDEIKHIAVKRAKKMQLQELKTLFPQMSETYTCFKQTFAEQEQLINLLLNSDANPEESLQIINTIKENKENNEKLFENEQELTRGMLIEIKPNQCFPVDCILVDSKAVVDESHITGEPLNSKKSFSKIHAGAVNISQKVTVFVLEDSYHSTVNKLLFKANRLVQKPQGLPNNSKNWFALFYVALLLTGAVASFVIPYCLATLSISLFLQNMIGILFVICPCTMVIAHQLPKILTRYQRSRSGIILCNEDLLENAADIHTIVIDKTGTITTGKSEVESFIGIQDSLWDQIFLLEQTLGGKHPLAQAILRYYSGTIPIAGEVIDGNIDACGLSGKINGSLIHIGNDEYLTKSKVNMEISAELAAKIDLNMSKGYSVVFVALNHIFHGVIFIRHQIRPNILQELKELSKDKDIIMLTGDKLQSAIGFNKQNQYIFGKNHEWIAADHTPAQKEAFLIEKMQKIDPRGVWFIGDGINDSLSARIVTEEGGVSCAITAEDKAAYFTDLSLNGSLKYLMEHNKLNRFTKKTVLQNQGILLYGALLFLAFIITFSSLGVCVSPVISLIIMLGTTLTVLFNSTRSQLAVSNALDKVKSRLNQFLVSDWSISLIILASALFVTGILISGVIAGHLVLPTIIFNQGLISAISSACFLSAVGISLLLVGLTLSCLCIDQCFTKESSKPIIEKSREKSNLIYRETLELKEVPSFKFNLGLSSVNRSLEHSSNLTDLSLGFSKIP